MRGGVNGVRNAVPLATIRNEGGVAWRVDGFPAISARCPRKHGHHFAGPAIHALLTGEDGSDLVIPGVSSGARKGFSNTISSDAIRIEGWANHGADGLPSILE